MILTTLLTILGCGKSEPPAPKPVDISTLTFPAVVIFDSTSIFVENSPETIKSMSMGYVMNFKDWPVLIDSNFGIFVIADRASAGAGVEAAGGGGSDFEHAATVSATMSTMRFIKGLLLEEFSQGGPKDQEKTRWFS